MRELKFRAWDGKHMDYDYRDACLWNGLLVAEGDTLLMQFTGFTDRVGKEMYEGDIVRHSNGYSLTHIEDIHAFCGDAGIYGDYAEDVEIIGTIYENPQLLGSH